jgi:paired amphipathic helix protein Sin3a
MPNGTTVYPAGVESSPKIQTQELGHLGEKIPPLDIKQQPISPALPLPLEQPPVDRLQVATISTANQDEQPSPAPFAKNPSPGVSNSASNAATVLGGMAKPNDTPEKDGNTDFRHAINYINRIKTRFGERQDVYKEFLQLLQSYQKEQMTMQEVGLQELLFGVHLPFLLRLTVKSRCCSREQKIF